MSVDVLREAVLRAARGEALGLATVVATKGSTPRKIGARLLVMGSQRVAGTLGGGAMEAEACRETAEVAAGGGARLREYVLAAGVDDWGHACAGTMVVLIERVPPGGVPWIPAALAGADGEAPVAVVTALDGTVGARVLVGETGVSGSLGHAGLDAAAEELGRRVLAGETAESCDTGAGRLYGEPFDRPPALVIVGAGHVGKALASLGRFLGVEVTVVDDRPEYANRERFPEADRILAAPVREALARLPIGPRTGIIVAMRNHDLDYEATAAALDTRARFVGLLGARRKAAMAAERLAAAGVSPVRIRALRCPVGLDIGARTPEEIAVAIAGEWIMAREGGTGASLARPDGAGRKDARTAASA